MNDTIFKCRIQDVLRQYLDITAEDAVQVVNWARQTWYPITEPRKEMYLQLVSDDDAVLACARDFMEAIVFNPLRLSKFIGSYAAILDLVDLHRCVPIVSEDDFETGRGEYEHFLANGANSHNKIILMHVVGRKKIKPRAYDIYGYKVILGKQAIGYPTIAWRCLTVKINSNSRDLTVLDVFRELDQIEEDVLFAWGNQEFWNRVSGLIHTSVEDARSTANLMKDTDAIKLALQQASLEGRKSLSHMLRTKLRKCEKVKKS